MKNVQQVFSKLHKMRFISRREFKKSSVNLIKVEPTDILI